MKNKKGFTLVELLVVIAIIGILSSVAVVNLNAARDKAKRAAVLASLSGLSPVVQLCLDQTGTPTTTKQTGTGAGGPAICNPATSITTTWPKIDQHGFNYANAFTGASYSAGTWQFKAENTSATGTNINCTESGCQ